MSAPWWGRGPGWKAAILPGRLAGNRVIAWHTPTPLWPAWCRLQAEPVEMHGPPLSADAVAHERKLLRGFGHRGEVRMGASRRLTTTARLERQDKSREVRPGRLAEERRGIRHAARGARKHDSVPIRATHWTMKTMRTSCAAPYARNEMVRMLRPKRSRHRAMTARRAAAGPAVGQSRLAPARRGSAGSRP